MNKNLWLICAVLFVFVTVFVIASDTSVPNRRVRFTNQSFEINNKGNGIVNDSNAKINFSRSNIKNKDIKTNDSDIKISSTDIENKNINYNNSSNYSNQETSFENTGTEYTNHNLGVQNQGNLNYKNVDYGDLDSRLEQAKNISTEPVDVSNKPFRMMPKNKYAYKNIDWSTWKSNFVNAILDESVSIKELDNYPNGAWFYYQFNVDATGKISDIVVKSMYLDYLDKQKVIKLIKSFEYSELTIFPRNTKRKVAKVSAVMMLSSETQHARPNDFNDFEQVKIQLN